MVEVREERIRVDADIAVGQVRFCLNGESGYRMIHIVLGHLSSPFSALLTAHPPGLRAPLASVRLI